jgi:hypothetical protein
MKGRNWSSVHGSGSLALSEYSNLLGFGATHLFICQRKIIEKHLEIGKEKMILKEKGTDSRSIFLSHHHLLQPDPQTFPNRPPDRS